MRDSTQVDMEIHAALTDDVDENCCRPLRHSDDDVECSSVPVPGGNKLFENTKICDIVSIPFNNCTGTSHSIERKKHSKIKRIDMAGGLISTGDCNKKRTIENLSQADDGDDSSGTIQKCNSTVSKGDDYSTEDSSDDSDGSPVTETKSSTSLRSKLAFCMFIVGLIIIGLSILYYLKTNNNNNSSNDNNSIETEFTFSSIPTQSPVKSEANVPATVIPTEEPSKLPTGTSTISPTTPYRRPTNHPGARPKLFPTKMPSNHPTNLPTKQPTVEPTKLPTGTPTYAKYPSLEPTKSPTYVYAPIETLIGGTAAATITQFYVVGDLPYNEVEKEKLLHHVENIPKEADFLVHIGDMRSAKNGDKCVLSEYEEIAEIFKKSSVPTFIVPGDNEYNDCPNAMEGLGFFRTAFGDLEKNWNASYQVHRDGVRPENFYFVHKLALYIGLNIVGGTVHNTTEWESRLSYQFEWVKGLIETFVIDNSNETKAGSVVIFGHAFPLDRHDAFFEPLEEYVTKDLKEKIPMLYVHGDKHFFAFNQKFMGDNFQSIMVEGGDRDPPLQVTVNMPEKINDKLKAKDIFSFDRML